MRKIKIINMLKKIRIIALLLPLSLTMLFNSCATEDEIVEVITEKTSSDTNLIELKNQSLEAFRDIDLSILFELNNNDLNYDKMIELMEHNQSDDIVNYEEILGDFYNEAYFNKLEELYHFGEQISQSEYFPKDLSTSESTQILEEVLIFVFLENLPLTISSKNTSNCLAYYNNCNEQAVRDHGIRLAGCTAGAIGLAVFTLGVGALTWPVCMATSGYLYDSAMTGCRNSYEICKQQQ